MYHGRTQPSGQGGRNFIQGDLTSRGLRDLADTTSRGGGGGGGAVRVK